MTDQQINEAIAKARRIQLLTFAYTDGRGVAYSPSYTTDLNAIAEVEADAKLIGGYSDYIDCLIKACGSKRLGALVFATARQRCEAFLRNKGLWIDEEQKETK